MIDGEYLMDYDELMNKSEEGIEKPLIAALYPKLGPSEQKEIEAQHLIDYYDMPVTLPDFAFPDAKIAIYCDGYEFHSERDAFQKDRQQSRELQLQGWCVLRFAGREILNETDAVVRTIEQAIRRENQQKRPTLDYFDEISTTTPPVVRTIEQAVRRRSWRDMFSIGGAFAAGLVAAVVLMILVESIFPTLFYHLTSGL